MIRRIFEEITGLQDAFWTTQMSTHFFVEN